MSRKIKQIINNTVNQAVYLKEIKQDWSEKGIVDFSADFMVQSKVAYLATNGEQTLLSALNLNINGSIKNINDYITLDTDYTDVRIKSVLEDYYIAVCKTATTAYALGFMYDSATGFTQTDSVELEAMNDYEIAETNYTTTKRIILSYSDGTVSNLQTIDINAEGELTVNAIFEVAALPNTHPSLSKLDGRRIAVAYTQGTTDKVVVKVVEIATTLGTVTQKSTKTLGTLATDWGNILYYTTNLIVLTHTEITTGDICEVAIKTYSVNPSTFTLTLKDTDAIEDVVDLDVTTINDFDIQLIDTNDVLVCYSTTAAAYYDVWAITTTTSILSEKTTHEDAHSHTKLNPLFFNSKYLQIFEINALTGVAEIDLFEIEDGTFTTVFSVADRRYVNDVCSLFFKAVPNTAISSDELTLNVYVTLDNSECICDVDWINIIADGTLSGTTLSDTINFDYPIEGVKIVVEYPDTARSYDFKGTFLTSYK